MPNVELIQDIPIHYAMFTFYDPKSKCSQVIVFSDRHIDRCVGVLYICDVNRNNNNKRRPQVVEDQPTYIIQSIRSILLLNIINVLPC